MSIQYTACGLDYVYLRNGYLLRHGHGTAIRDPAALGEAIAAAIITRACPLRAQEVRFLRTVLKFSQAKLAQALQTTRVTVARWEGGADEAIPGTADTALRLLYAAVRQRDDLTKQVCHLLCENDASGRGPVDRLTLRQTARGWEYDQGFRPAPASIALIRHTAVTPTDPE